MKMYRCKGTITVFLSIVSILFLSLACTLVESARLQGARAKAAAVSDISLFSVFGEYERGLLKNYDVFFLDGGYGSGEFQKELAEEHLKKYLEGNSSMGMEGYLRGMQMFPLVVEDCQIEQYGLMTDAGGAAFYEQVVKNVKETLGTELVSRYLERQNQAKDQEKAGKDYEDSLRKNGTKLAEAEEAVRKAEEEESQEDGVIVVKESEVPQEVKENPLDIIEKVKKMGILGLVVKDPASVSQKTIEKSELPTGRSLEKGNMEVACKESGLTADAIFQDYLAEHFPCMTSEEEKKTEGTLEYQLEYILGGKASDMENLKYVVNRLLLMREGTNFVFALADPTMRRQAEALAVSLAGVTGAAILAPVVTTALLLAWAYGESLLDVRTLLSGGKVELVKNAENWKLSLSRLGKILEVLKECDEGGGQGLGYEEYLRLLLAAKSGMSYVMRTLDMIEADLRLQKGTENFRADHCLVRVQAKTEWRLPAVFLRVPMAFLGRGGNGQNFSVNGYSGYL